MEEATVKSKNVLILLSGILKIKTNQVLGKHSEEDQNESHNKHLSFDDNGEAYY